MILQQILSPAILNVILSEFKISIDKIEFQATRKDFEGDITMVIFQLLKFIIMELFARLTSDANISTLQTIPKKF